MKIGNRDNVFDVIILFLDLKKEQQSFWIKEAYYEVERQTLVHM